MTGPSGSWEVWAAGATVLSVVLVLIGYMFRFAANEGARIEREKQLAIRVTDVEKRQDAAERDAKDARDGAADAKAQMAAFEATLTALSATVHIGFEEVKTAIRDLGGVRGRRSGSGD